MSDEKNQNQSHLRDAFAMLLYPDEVIEAVMKSDQIKALGVTGGRDERSPRMKPKAGSNNEPT